MATTFDIVPDKTYYLVSVIHSTEDSYKRKDKEKSYSVEIINNNGNMYKISSSPWVGYFECLEEVRIDGIQLKL